MEIGSGIGASALPVPVSEGGTGATTAAGARTNLGLGTMAVQDKTAVDITGGTIVGITDLAVADGGTGASNSAAARTNLGVGTMGVQDSAAVAITGGVITGITDLAVADGGTGASTAANARTNLGLGTIATQAASAVAITGGTITGITDLAVADGGTGASTAAGARTNLGVLTPSQARAVRTTPQAVADSTDVAISWSSADYDSDAYWSGGAPTLFTAPFTGRYQVGFNVAWAFVAALNSRFTLQLNGADLLYVSGSGLGAGGINTQLALTAGDTLRVRAFQQSGGSVDIGANTADFYINRIA